MDINPTDISVHNKTCYGCNNNNSDIMIAFFDKIDKKFYDVFLTNDQAKNLIEDIKIVLKENEND